MMHPQLTMKTLLDSPSAPLQAIVHIDGTSSTIEITGVEEHACTYVPYPSLWQVQFSPYPSLKQCQSNSQPYC